MTSDDDETSYIILIIFVFEIFPQALLIRCNNLKTLSIIKPNFIKTLATGGISKSMTTNKTWLMFGIDFCDVQMKPMYHLEFSTNFFMVDFL